ncbi:hypothetical protein NIES4072_11940 [Nostoc commune NIES-4072]|uniref:Uncharacterized protein n=1 Tax=Nostoc commune NIES-4072 TaxID=2005467 RepID=A0A2R5FPH8_NOSCO|nr:hypothetical protein NIES4070_14880 [Nostoc commune HK-02]GBG17534.1 hypothetical protein NIES4072_11940 [Nostoc commune NIES-4072]
MTKTPIKISTLEEYINFDDGTDQSSNGGLAPKFIYGG